MRKFVSLVVLTIMVWATSCTPQKELIYMQGIDSLSTEQIIQNYRLKIQNDDMLSIKVGTTDDDLLKPFGSNLFLGQVGMSNSAYNSAPKMNYYQVDQNGYINLPVFGKMKAGEMTCPEFEKILAKKMKDEGYAYDPVVSVKIMNFKVSILGDVKNPGNISVEGDRITLLEAISKAGDLQPGGLRKNVLILREENGVRTTGRVDLTSTDFLSSPYYYLKQNDVIYVESNRSLSVKASPFITYWSASSSIISIIISIVSLVSVLSK